MLCKYGAKHYTSHIRRLGYRLKFKAVHVRINNTHESVLLSIRLKEMLKNSTVSDKCLHLPSTPSGPVRLVLRLMKAVFSRGKLCPHNHKMPEKQNL